LALSLALCGCQSRERRYQSIKEEINREEFESALRHVDAALAIPQRQGDEWNWRLRILKARILVSRNQHNQALEVLDGDLPAAFAGTEIAEQRELYRGMAHRYGQEYALAERDFDHAEEIVNALSAPFQFQLLIARGDLEVDEKKYANAEIRYKRALAMAHQENLPPSFEVNALGDLGRVATSREHFDEAIDVNQRALDLSRKLKMQVHMATILGNLGWAYFELGDFENAIQFYKQGAEQSAQSGLRGNSAYWFTGLANSYLALHDDEAAEKLARTTLEKARELKNAQTTTASLNTLTEIMLGQGQVEEAERFNLEAMKIEKAGLDKFGTSDSLLWEGHIAAARRRFGEADTLFYQVLDDPNTETPLRWEAEAGLAEVQDGQGRSVEAERLYLKAINTIEQARRSINHDELRLSFLSSGIEVYGAYLDFLIRRGRSADALKQAELSRALTLEEGLSADEADRGSQPTPGVEPRQVARRLKSTLLFYWVGEKHSYLWVITPAKTSCLPLPAAAGIDPIVKSYRDALVAGRDPLATGNTDGQKLYSLLIEPAKNLIPQGSRVILLPDGSLYGLNFETLIVPGSTPHYWIEDVTLTTASSLTLLASAAARPAPKEKTMFLVGDTLSPNADFPALPNAAAEMQSIEKYFPEPRRAVLSGSAATPTAYLSSKPEQYAYLHFVTHGTASRARPLESAVVLSKQKDEDSYKLYARDIVKRRLTAYLVTISACKGAGTRAFSGEGLVGLSWAFLRAGAHNVIGALWEVSDTSTPELMDKLYDGLSRGEDPASALRAAKLSLLHQDSVYKKPRYWAPFQLYIGS
jgi:CHAT domain-containing protein/predicted negative regulator of RcsB-dependent stress response